MFGRMIGFMWFDCNIDPGGTGVFCFHFCIHCHLTKEPVGFGKCGHALVGCAEYVC